MTEYHPALVHALFWLEGQPTVSALLIMMLLDVFSGLCAAVVTKSVSSSISWRGMMKKVLTLLVLAMAMVLDPFANGLPISKLVSICFIVTEGISILENAAVAGVPLPPQLMDLLLKMRADSKPIPQVEPPHSTVTVTTKVDNMGETVITKDPTK